MRKIFKITLREYKVSVRTKGFIIGLVLAPIVMGGSLIAFALLKDRVDTTDKKIVILDRSGQLADAIIQAADYHNQNEIYDKETGKKIRPSYFFEVVEPMENDLPGQRLGISNRIRNGDIHAFVEIGPEVVHPGENREAFRIGYYARNAAMDELRGWLTWPINDQLRKLRLADAGIDESEVKDLFVWINIDGLGLVSVDEITGDIQDARQASEIEAIIVPIIIMMLMFLMIMMSVPGMLHSVMEEKTQRIAEVLLGSIRPFEFMMGKLLGGIAVSLTSSAVYFIGGILVIRYMGYERFIPYHVLPWFFVYMLCAIIMMGAMAAALGSTCSEPKDSQNLTFPTILPAIFPMFIYFPVVKEPMGSFATVTSLIPTFTPLLMLLRQTTPAGIPIWQPIAGMLGVLVFTIFCVWAGGRIFRVAILLQGTPPKLSNIIRWAFKG
ncbi:ABC transporter permease [candidate division KSB1 bacterium]|nr:ABC transporter permease [candidate division KSB1 bacterium]